MSVQYVVGEDANMVEFDDPYGDRMTGKIVRVYNTRTIYHAEVDGQRYTVDVSCDNPKKVS